MSADILSPEIVAQFAAVAASIRALPDHELCRMLQLAALGDAAQRAPRTVTTPLPAAEPTAPKPKRSVPASDPQDVDVVTTLVNGVPDGVAMAKITEAMAAASPTPWTRSKTEAACRNAVLQSKIGRVGEKKGARLVRVDYPGAVYGPNAYD
jgi:hypothetical protein